MSETTPLTTKVFGVVLAAAILGGTGMLIRHESSLAVIGARHDEKKNLARRITVMETRYEATAATLEEIKADQKEIMDDMKKLLEAR